MPSTNGRFEVTSTPGFATALAKFPDEARGPLTALHSRRDFAGIITSAEAASLATLLDASVAQLMFRLVPFAALFAKPPVSQFYVGAVSRGTTAGNLYYGANMEFAGQALSFTVHAEQASVTNAWLAGEEGLDLIAISAPPCGYCRQFLNELTTADQLFIELADAPKPLAHFLPEAFGPRDLGINGGLLQPDHHGLALDQPATALLDAALRAANQSYAPYSKGYAGIALRMFDDAIFAGAYAENAAFNPSMSPLEVALSRMNLAGYVADAIADAALVHNAGGVMQVAASEAVLSAVTGVRLQVATAS